MAAKKPTRKSTSNPTSSPRAPDAIALLRADHKKVSAMFDRYENLRTKKQKQDLATDICQELSVHAQIEEEIFYPAAREVLDEQDLLDEATVEHQSCKDLIAQLEESSPDEELFDAKVKVLGEYIHHHVEEEQNEMFPKVKKTELDLKALGEQMLARKEELMGELV